MDIFTKFKQYIKIRPVLVDNEVFQLHYRVTTVLLLACGALVASKQHFGDPIDCITKDDVPNKIMDTFCWIHSTFTLPNACNKTVGVEVAHPCVETYNNHSQERVYHKYYQWVYFVLFFQAACFYAPHLFWKSHESKLMSQLTVELELKSPLKDKDKQKGQISKVVNYMMKDRYQRHREYFLYFTLCEFINFVNVILQIYLVDEFLGGTFTTFGLDVLSYSQMDQENRVDPMVKVFPRMTKCRFNRYGASGDIQHYDALCILPLNIINEKIYIIMWFWFVFLGLVTGIWLIYRIFTMIDPKVRFKVLKRRATLVDEEVLEYVVSRVTAADWFVLSMMSKNMDSQWYKFLIKYLHEKYREKDNKNERIKIHSNGRHKRRDYDNNAHLKGKGRNNGSDDDVEAGLMNSKGADDRESSIDTKATNDQSKDELQ